MSKRLSPTELVSSTHLEIFNENPTYQQSEWATTLDPRFDNEPLLDHGNYSICANGAEIYESHNLSFLQAICDLHNRFLLTED